MAPEGREIDPDKGHTERDKVDAQKLFNRLPSDVIDWTVPAKLVGVEGADDFTGTLGECAKTYKKASPGARHAARIETNDPIDMPGYPDPIGAFEGPGLEWLASTVGDRHT